METALRIRNILFKAFVLNYILVLVVWLLSLTELFPYLMSFFFQFDSLETAVFMVNIFGIWKTLGVVFFLIPAAAIHWEYASEKIKTKKKK